MLKLVCFISKIFLIDERGGKTYHIKCYPIWKCKILYFIPSKDLPIWWLIWLQFRFLGHLQKNLSLNDNTKFLTVATQSDHIFPISQTKNKLIALIEPMKKSQFNPNHSCNLFNNYLEFLEAVAAKEIAIYKIDNVPDLITDNTQYPALGPEDTMINKIPFLS